MATDKNRRAAERRRLQRQMERRRQQAARRKRINMIVSIVAVLVVIGGVVALIATTSGSDDKTAASEPPVSTTAAPSTSDVPAYPCTWTPADASAKKVSPPSTKTPPKTGTVQVAVRTSRGSMTFTLDRAKAPCAVASFLSLTSQKFYNATACHRLTTGPNLYVLQCGSADGKGQGGGGYSFGDEVTGNEKYTQGVLAMANSGPDSNQSQFFIVYKNSRLQPDYTIFGSVTKGLDVVTKVAAKGVTGGGQDGAPAQPISLTKLSIAK